MNLKVKAFTDGEYNEGELNTFLTEIGDRVVSVTPFAHKQTNSIMYSVVYREETVEEEWRVGDKVRITDCIKGHEFELGATVELLYRELDTWVARSIRNDDEWNIFEEEATKIN